MFSDILLTVDFDRTLTDTHSRIPQRNLEAIRYFIENGGAFTINTGRSFNTYRAHLEEVPTNAPLLLYNGSAAWENGKLVNTQIIDFRKQLANCRVDGFVEPLHHGRPHGIDDICSDICKRTAKGISQTCQEFP